MTQRAYLIDASIYIFRAWFSLPDRWHTRDGWPLNAVYGYCSFLLDFIESTGTKGYVGVAFDESLGTCFRNEIMPGYKSSRELPEAALAFQLKACRHLTECFGMPCFGGPRYEADDYQASLAREFQQQRIAVSIITRDKDLSQILFGPGDQWWDFAGDCILDAVGVEKKFGVAPHQFADYLALVGDPIDDVPGVPGIGPKTAVRLLLAFGDITTLQQQLDSVSTLKIRGAASIEEKLREHWAQLEQARQVTALESHIPEISGMPVFSLHPHQLDAVLAYLQELNIQGPLLRRCAVLQQSVSG